jgi:hypothetical protein
MQEIVSGLDKKQRGLFFIHDVRVDNTERELQATSCSGKSGSGFHLRTPGRIIISHVILGIGEREHGGFKMTLTRNGRFLVLVHFYGFMENVRISHRAFSPLETDAFFLQRVRERASFGTIIFQ